MNEDTVQSELAMLRTHALERLADVDEGDALEPLIAAYVAFGVASCATTMNDDGMRAAASSAIDLGATLEELAEVTVLVSAVGMHSMNEGARVLKELARESGPKLPEPAGPDAEYLAKLLADPYWQRLDEQLPDFADTIVRLSPEAFRGFVDYCSVPWRAGSLPAKTKELVYLGIDATQTHRYGPGFRIHLGNAIDLGSSRREILEVLEIAAAAGPPRGVA